MSRLHGSLPGRGTAGVVLALAALAASPASLAVTVVSGAPNVDTAQAPIQTVVTKELIMQLPASRNANEILTLTLATPGPAPADPVAGVDRTTFLVDGGGKGPTFPPGTTIDFGDGRPLPFGPTYAFRIDDPNAPFSVTIRRPGTKRPLVNQPVRLPLIQNREFPTYPPYVPENRFATPPVAVAGRTHVIRGPLSGDGTKTKVAIGGKPVRIVAENPRSVFFEVPDDTPAGFTKVTIDDGGRRAEIPIAVVTIAMSADRLKLKKGQTTRFHATISGPESWGDAAWKAGAPSDLCDVAALRKKFPDFQPPEAGGEGFLMFSITNLSPGVISISEFARPLRKGDFAAGRYTYDGAITAVADGGFGIHGEVQAFVAPASGEATPAGNK